MHVLNINFLLLWVNNLFKKVDSAKVRNLAFLTILILLSLSLNSSIDRLDIDCLKISSVNKSSVEDIEKVLTKDIRGNWEKLSDVKKMKLNQCDKKVIKFLIESEQHFLDLESKEYECKKINQKLSVKKFLIDECCILKWRQEELEGWKKLNKKGGEKPPFFCSNLHFLL